MPRIYRRRFCRPDNGGGSRPLWLLDEPTNALDAAGQSLFVALMGDHLARGGLIIAATHAPLGVPAKELRLGGTS
jgi:heme exporter protein A